MSPLETSQKFFNDIAREWDCDHDIDRLSRLLSIFTDLIPQLESPILDVGCGTGILVPVLREITTANPVIVELDISENMLKLSKAKNKDISEVFFSIGDAHFAPFPDATFNSIICFAVYPHFYNQQLALNELNRLLKPGGLMIILHLMGHKELNEMHRKAGSAVERHALQAINLVNQEVESGGFSVLSSVERSDLYLITAVKSLSS